jgi:hypothetical protein
MTDQTPPEHRAVPALELPELPELPQFEPAVIGTLEHVFAGAGHGPFRKLLFQLAAPLATLLLVALSGQVQLVPLLTAAAGVLTAIAVYQLPDNDDRVWTTAKAIAAFLSAAVQALVVLLVGGLALGEIQPAEWIGVIVQALAAIGVAVIPNDALPAAGGEQVDAGDPPALPAASR